MTDVIIVIRVIQILCLLVIFMAVVMSVVDRWQNNHFIDDMGRKYKRTKGGFKYY